MKFWEAMKALEEGKKITNNGGKSYYFIKDNKLMLCTGKLMGASIALNIDYMSHEWEIYEEKKEVDPKFKEMYRYLKDEHGFVNEQYGDFICERNEDDHLLAFYTQLLEMAKYYKLD